MPNQRNHIIQHPSLNIRFYWSVEINSVGDNIKSVDNWYCFTSLFFNRENKFFVSQ